MKHEFETLDDLQQKMNSQEFICVNVRKMKDGDVEATGNARLEQDLAAQQEQIIKLNREFKEFKDEVKKELAGLKSMLAQYLIQSVDEKDEAIDKLLEQI